MGVQNFVTCNGKDCTARARVRSYSQSDLPMGWILLKIQQYVPIITEQGAAVKGEHFEHHYCGPCADIVRFRDTPSFVENETRG